MIRAAVVLAILAAPAAAKAQTIAFPSFPTSRDFSAAARWMEREAATPRRDLMQVADGLAFAAVHDLGPPAPTAPTAVHVETLDAEAWKLLGGRSAVLFVEPGCGGEAPVIRSADLYSGANLLGEARRGLPVTALPITGETLRGLSRALCLRLGQRPPQIAQAAPPPPAAPPLPAPPTAARPALLPPAAQPSSERPVPITPPPVAARTPSPAPAPVAAPPAPARAAPPRLPAQGSPTVQIGAFNSQGAAMLAFRDLATGRPGLFDGLLQRLEPVAAQGATLYRAVVTGFPGPAEAAAFCRTLVAAGRPCLVRPDP